MTEAEIYLELLEQNRTVLSRHIERHDMNDIREIIIRSQYKDWDTAMLARGYVVKKYGKQKEVRLEAASVKYAEDDVDICLKFTIWAVPEAELITRHEIMLKDAADEFGGDMPSWEISLEG